VPIITGIAIVTTFTIIVIGTAPLCGVRDFGFFQQV
jgi:hypothetical protein